MLTSFRQLLFYPFTHLFIVFGHILSDPHAQTCLEDLQLLHEATSFFLRMRNNHDSAEKLEKIASTFAKLAEDYVRRSRREKTVQKDSRCNMMRDNLTAGNGRDIEQNPPSPNSGAGGDGNGASASSLSPGGTRTSQRPSIASGSSGNSPLSTFEHVTEPPPVLMDYFNSVAGQEFDFNAFNPDVSLGSASGDAGFLRDADAQQFGYDAGVGGGGNVMNMDTESIMQSLGDKAAKKPLGFNFDWLTNENVVSSPGFNAYLT